MLVQSLTFSMWGTYLAETCLWCGPRNSGKPSPIAPTLDQPQRGGKREGGGKGKRQKWGKKAKTNDCSHIPGTSEGSQAELSVINVNSHWVPKSPDPHAMLKGDVH